MNTLVISLAALAGQAPPANKVVAGWGAFGIVMLMVVAVALLGWSLTRHLKKAQRNADEGVFAPSNKRPRRTTI
jgi:hypothetical protein